MPSRSEESERLTDDGLSDSDYEGGTVVGGRGLEAGGARAERRSLLFESALNVRSMLLTVAVCIGYMLVGPLLIMSNKYLLTTAHFSYPILLTAMHQSFSALCCAVVVHVLRLVPLQYDAAQAWSAFHCSFLSVGAASSAALCTGNSAYLYLTVAFIEMLKGFTPIVTMAVQAVFGEPLPRCRIVAATLAISLGTAISSYGELRLSVTGLLLMLGSVYSEATRLMLTQKLLQRMDFHVIEGLYYLAPASALFALLLGAAVELPHFESRRFFRRELPANARLFALNMALGFVVNVAGFLVIKRTNVVTLKLLAIARNALVVVAGVLVFDETVGELQLLGYAISLTFFLVYNYFQIAEMRRT